jgi:hypothetical protein
MALKPNAWYAMTQEPASRQRNLLTRQRNAAIGYNATKSRQFFVDSVDLLYNLFPQHSE